MSSADALSPGVLFPLETAGHRSVAPAAVAVTLIVALAIATAGPSSATPATGIAVADRSRAGSAPGIGRHADPALEALLPQTLGGVALTLESQAGTELSTRSAAFDAFLARVGRTRDDFAVASAYAHGGLRAEIGAWRVTDVAPEALLPAFIEAMQASSKTPLVVVDERLAGRPVTRIGDPGQLARGPLYVVVHHDALLFVQTPDRSLAEEAMQKLPR